MKGKLLKAKFPGTCKACLGGIETGTEVYWIKGYGVWHTSHGIEAGASAGAPAPPKEYEPPVITAKFNSSCLLSCGEKISAGEKVYWVHGVGVSHRSHGAPTMSEAVAAITHKPEPKANAIVTAHGHTVIAPLPKEELGDFTRVYALFALAKTHLKYPKIRLHYHAEGGTVSFHLYVSGPKSAVPGTINVVGGTYGSGLWYGRITLEGEFTTRRKGVPADMIGVLLALASNPEAVAAEFGKLTGACSFCGKALEDEKSTTVGYGPVCAKHWKLPWGVKAAKVKKKELVESAKIAAEMAVEFITPEEIEASLVKAAKKAQAKFEAELAASGAPEFVGDVIPKKYGKSMIETLGLGEPIYTYHVQPDGTIAKVLSPDPTKMTLEEKEE